MATIRIALAWLAMALAFASCDRPSDQREETAAPTVDSHQPLRLGMTPQAVEKHLETATEGWRIADVETVGNQQRVSYAVATAVQVVAHYEDGETVEIFWPANGDRLPTGSRPQFALGRGKSVAACEAELTRLKGWQRYYLAEDPRPDGSVRVLFGNPQDARTTVVVYAKDDRLTAAYWFGTGESLLPPATR